MGGHAGFLAGRASGVSGGEQGDQMIE